MVLGGFLGSANGSFLWPGSEESAVVKLLDNEDLEDPWGHVEISLGFSWAS